MDILRRGSHLVTVLRNDEISVADAIGLNPSGLLISPGPGRPADSGISLPLVRALAGSIPILGICLGHQLLGELFGAKLCHAPEPVHGKTSQVYHDGQGVFRGLPQPMRAMRYHSLLLANIPENSGLTISGRTATGEIMGIRHKFLNFAGVQFHPESVLTDRGDEIIRNWMEKIPREVDRISNQEISR